MNPERWYLPVIGRETPQEIKNNFQAEQEKKAAIEHLFNEAKQKGYQKGMDEAATFLTVEKEKLSALCNTFKNALEVLDEAVISKLYGVVITAVQQVFKHTIEVNPGFLLTHIESELQKFSLDIFPVCIHLSSMDFDALKTYQHFSEERLQFKADPALNRGSYKITTAQGEIDGSFENRLTQLTAVLCGVTEREFKSTENYKRAQASRTQSPEIPPHQSHRQSAGTSRHGDEGERMPILPWQPL